MPSEQGFFAANCLCDGAIQFEGGSRGATGGAEAYDTKSLPAKMKTPGVASGVEQADFFSGFLVARGQTGSFAQRAGNAGEREIIEKSFTSCCNRQNVVNVEDRFLAGLRKAAVFATVLSPLNYLPSQMRRDSHSFRNVGGLNVVTWREAKKAFPQDPQARRLRVSRRMSGKYLGLVCRAATPAVVERPWAIETGPNRLASLFQRGSFATYSCFDFNSKMSVFSSLL